MMNAQQAQSSRATSGGRIIRQILKYKEQYLMISPTVLLILLFGVFPVLYVLFYSFTEFDGFSPPKFVCFYNYLRVFQDQSWWLTVWNTLVLGIGIPLVQIPFALVIAVLLNMKLSGTNFFRAFIFLPNITSTAIMGVVFYFMFASFNGVVNAMLHSVHLIAQPIEWLGNGVLAKLVIVIFQAWYGIGLYMVLFLAALQRIPINVYESATIDGANKIQSFFYITLPLLGKMFQIISALSILNALKLFDSIKALTNGGPGNKTEVMTMYIFRYFFESTGIAQQGYASAVCIVATILVALVTLIYLFGTRKFGEKSLL
jgi:raffinose/stachyose/melibiose transport system permease protein